MLCVRLQKMRFPLFRKVLFRCNNSNYNTQYPVMRLLVISQPFRIIGKLIVASNWNQYFKIHPHPYTA